MTEEELRAAVNRVIEMSGDDEAAHSEEDHLRLKVIQTFCPSWVVAEIERLREEPFARWCA